MKTVGSTFGQELVEAGLGHVGVTWNPVQFDAAVSEADRTAVMALVEAHDPERAARLDQIAQIERENPISHRALREFVLAVCQKSNIDMAAVPGLKRVAEVEAEIAAVRAKL